MFHNIPEPMQERMKRLEAIDAQDRVDGTPRLRRLRQIPPETGKFLAILAANSPPGEFVEIGTSAGYSTLWLLLACKASQRVITTYEYLPEKVNLAQETFRLAQVKDRVNLVEGDARDHLAEHTGVSFCFLDAEKEIYSECYQAIIPNLAPGGLLVADNAINHQETLQPVIERALGDHRVDSLVVPIGKGLLVCRKTSLT